MSDQKTPSVQNVIVPSRGNSLRHSVTKLRPGALSAGGVGVDIKHDSYERFLRKLKKDDICKDKRIDRNVCVSVGCKLQKNPYKYSVGDIVYVINPITNMITSAKLCGVCGSMATVQLCQAPGNSRSYTLSRKTVFTLDDIN